VEVGSVAEDSGVVGVHANAVAEHLLLVKEVGIGAEVVCKVHFLVHNGGAGGAAAGSGGAIREGRHGNRGFWFELWADKGCLSRVYGVVYFKGVLDER
jgi:hypothetical protein